MVSLLVCSLLAASVSDAVLVPVPSFGPLGPDPLPHIALSAGLLATSGAMALIKSSDVGSPRCRLTPGGACDPTSLTGLDRWSLGRSNGAWAKASDIGEIVGIAAPGAALLTLSLVTDPAPHALHPAWDLLLWAETMAACTFVDQGLKLALQRPRPTWYRSPSRDADAQASFPSGHSLATATGTSALTTLFFQRYPNSPWRWAVLSAGAAVTAATGWGRVEAGKHFVSDVLGGWLLGGTLGYVMPTLALRGLQLDLRRSVDLAGGSQAEISLLGRF